MASPSIEDISAPVVLVDDDADPRSASNRTGIRQEKVKMNPPRMVRGFASAPKIKQVVVWNFLILSSRALR